MLSGPIDVDKMDYLMRDSLHAGVPYGRNFDQQRLIGSLCVNDAGDGLAITDKGRTAAEMMVFARYVMFSEVYWHHAVRCATAMLQRAFLPAARYALISTPCFVRTKHEMIASMRRAARGWACRRYCWMALFGTTRRLYKRFAQYSAFQNPGPTTQSGPSTLFLVDRVRGEPGGSPAQHLAVDVAPHEVCSMPRRSSSRCNSTSKFTSPKRTATGCLGDVSPVVRTLAQPSI